MKLYTPCILLLLLLAGRVVAQVPLSEKNISLEEVQVKPREPKIWIQKGRPPLLPILHHSTRFYDLAGRKIDPPIYLNKVEPISSKHVQVTSIDTKLEPFDNDSFNVFFFVMQIQGTDTLITRKMILGHSIKRKNYKIKFSVGELTLLPQPFYMGFQFLPNKISTSYLYQLHTATRNTNCYLYLNAPRVLLKKQDEFGVTFNFKMQYYELE